MFSDFWDTYEKTRQKVNRIFFIHGSGILNTSNKWL